jgi:hypothetical protein
VIKPSNVSLSSYASKLNEMLPGFSHQYYWELSTNTYLAYLVFWNAIPCHIFQSIYYIIKHLQLLTQTSFQHLDGLQLRFVKHSNDRWFFWFSCCLGKLALMFHRNMLLPSARWLIMNQVDFEVTGRKKCASSLSHVQLNLLAPKFFNFFSTPCI